MKNIRQEKKSGAMPACNAQTSCATKQVVSHRLPAHVLSRQLAAQQRDSDDNRADVCEQRQDAGRDDCAASFVAALHEAMRMSDNRSKRARANFEQLRECRVRAEVRRFQRAQTLRAQSVDFRLQIDGLSSEPSEHSAHHFDSNVGTAARDPRVAAHAADGEDDQERGHRDSGQSNSSVFTQPESCCAHEM